MKTQWRWFGKQAGGKREPKSIGCRMLVAAASLGDNTAMIPTQLQMLGIDTKDLAELLQSASQIVLPHDERILALETGRVRFWHGCSAVGNQLVKMSLLGAARNLAQQFAGARIVPVLLQGGLTRSVPIPSETLELAAICLCLWLALGVGGGSACYQQWRDHLCCQMGGHYLVLVRSFHLNRIARVRSASSPSSEASFGPAALNALPSPAWLH